MSNQVQRVENPFGQAVAPVQSGSASAMAVAQREVAEVQAAMVIAKRFPRNQQEALDRIINACSRPSLAEVATYQYSRGGTDITGPSIRLAEELARNWGNIACGITELSRGSGVSECMAYCWDMETNFRDEKRFQVKHWRDTRSGGYALSDERDIYELIANQGSRRKRACILSVIPGDVQDTAVHQCDVTLRSQVDITDELLQKTLASFEKYGVTKAMIEERIQRRFDKESVGPGHILTLRKIYNSLKDGMSSTEDWFKPAKDAPVPEDARNGAQSKMDKIAGDKPAKSAKKAAASKKEPEPEKEKPESEDAQDEPEQLEEEDAADENESDDSGLFGPEG